MKKLLLAGTLIVVAWPSYTQTLIPKAGVTLSRAGLSADWTGDNGDVKSKFGVAIGMGYQILVSEAFSIQPELNFVQKGFKLEASETTIVEGFPLTTELAGTITISYLEIPVLAKFMFGSRTRFFLGTGPSVGIGLGGKAKFKTTELYAGVLQSDSWKGAVKFGEEPESNEDDLYFDHRFDLGAQVSAGVVVMEKIMLEFRYNAGLSNLMEKADDFDNRSRNNALQFWIGIPITL